MPEGVGLAESSVIDQQHVVFYPSVRFGHDGRIVDYRQGIWAVLIPQGDRPGLSVRIGVELETGCHAFPERHRAAYLAPGRIPGNVEMQIPRLRGDAIAGECCVGVLQIVVHVERVALHAGVHFALAFDGDVERIAGIAADVEIRRVVLSEIYPVFEHFVFPHGPNHQIRRILRGMVGILQPLVGNGGNNTLTVLRHVQFIRIASLSVHYDTPVAGNIFVFLRRRSRIAENCSTPGYVADLQRHDFHTIHSGSCGNAVRHFRHIPFEFQRRQRHLISRLLLDLKFPHRRHRQAPKSDHKVYRPVSNLRILQFPQIGIGIGDDIEFVVSRNAIKFQLHRRKIAVQNQLPGVGIEKIDVQVAYRVFIRRACERSSSRPVRMFRSPAGCISREQAAHPAATRPQRIIIDLSFIGS